MAAKFRGGVPNYPFYPGERVPWGKLPSASEMGPPDLRPWGMNPATSATDTRPMFLAGFGGNDMFSSDNADPHHKDYPNELDILAAADDVVGNGVFDPNGSHGNVHPDYGLFADHQNLPGYVDRERFYAPSEVRDLTAPNGQVMYVPGGAVAIDEAQRNAFLNRDMWTVPPGVNPWRPVDTGYQNIVPGNLDVTAVSGLSGTEMSTTTKYLAATLGVLVGIGVGYGIVKLMRK